MPARTRLPSQIGGPPGRCGVGPTACRSSAQRPSQVTGSPRHSARARRIPSSMRPTRRSNGTPAAVNSARIGGASAPIPMPRITRPSAIRSSVATWCASTTGLRSAGSSTAVPSATRRVRAAAAASSVSGSWRGFATSESPTHTESSPSASAFSASASSGAASWRPSITCSRVGSRYPSRRLIAWSSGSRSGRLCSMRARGHPQWRDQQAETDHGGADDQGTDHREW